MAVADSLGARISEGLKARAVDLVFGIPGVHNVELYRGIERAGICHVLARHEQGAGFMADGYARATGKPGIAFVISGPGLCNIMTPMGQAYSDSVPLLVISSCLDNDARLDGRGRLHEMKDQEAAAATVCDWSVTAHDAEHFWDLVDRAFSEFSSSRPLPKHVQVPVGVLGAAAPPAPGPRPLPARPRVAPDSIARAAEAIASARRPLFIIGGGAAAAAGAAREAASRAGAAVFSTFAGKGVVNDDYPLNFGSTLARPESIAVLRKADLLVVVGSRLSETDLWRDSLGHQAPTIRVDVDARLLVGEHPEDMQLIGDAAYFLSDLAGQLPQYAPGKDWDAGKVAAVRARLRASADAERPGISSAAAAVIDVLGEDGMVFSDMTQFAYVGMETCGIAGAGAWCHPSGFGTLGYALPAAVGAKAGTGGRPVVAVAGDYGFQFTMQELGTAVELGLGLPVVIWDNCGLREIKDCMTRAQIAPTATDVRNPDFSKLSEAYGAEFSEPADLEEFRLALDAGIQKSIPTLIRLTPAAVGG